MKNRVLAHYRDAAAQTPGADALEYKLRGFFVSGEADARVSATVLRTGGERARRAGGPRLRFAGASSSVQPGSIRSAVMGITLLDVVAMGLGLNPAIGREVQAFEPAVIARLREELPPGGRALGIGEGLLPNVLMRFGLSDIRNYDSVELARSLRWPRHRTTRARASGAEARSRGGGVAHQTRIRVRGMCGRGGRTSSAGGVRPGRAGGKGVGRVARRDAVGRPGVGAGLARDFSRRSMDANSNRFPDSREAGGEGDVRPGVDRPARRENQQITAEIRQFSEHRRTIGSS